MYLTKQSVLNTIVGSHERDLFVFFPFIGQNLEIFQSLGAQQVRFSSIGWTIYIEVDNLSCGLTPQRSSLLVTTVESLETPVRGRWTWRRECRTPSAPWTRITPIVSTYISLLAPRQVLFSALRYFFLALLLSNLIPFCRIHENSLHTITILDSLTCLHLFSTATVTHSSLNHAAAVLILFQKSAKSPLILKRHLLEHN